MSFVIALLLLLIPRIIAVTFAVAAEFRIVSIGLKRLLTPLAYLSHRLLTVNTTVPT